VQPAPVIVPAPVVVAPPVVVAHPIYRPPVWALVMVGFTDTHIFTSVVVGKIT
jgi:hypothetical protein